MWGIAEKNVQIQSPRLCSSLNCFSLRVFFHIAHILKSYSVWINLSLLLLLLKASKETFRRNLPPRLKLICLLDRLKRFAIEMSCRLMAEEFDDSKSGRFSRMSSSSTSLGKEDEASKSCSLYPIRLSGVVESTLSSSWNFVNPLHKSFVQMQAWKRYKTIPPLVARFRTNWPKANTWVFPELVGSKDPQSDSRWSFNLSSVDNPDNVWLVLKHPWALSARQRDDQFGAGKDCRAASECIGVCLQSIHTCYLSVKNLVNHDASVLIRLAFLQDQVGSLALPDTMEVGGEITTSVARQGVCCCNKEKCNCNQSSVKNITLSEDEQFTTPLFFQTTDYCEEMQKWIHVSIG